MEITRTIEYSTGLCQYNTHSTEEEITLEYDDSQVLEMILNSDSETIEATFEWLEKNCGVTKDEVENSQYFDEFIDKVDMEQLIDDLDLYDLIDKACYGDFESAAIDY